jgi:hypothetical protein
MMWISRGTFEAAAVVASMMLVKRVATRMVIRDMEFLLDTM